MTFNNPEYVEALLERLVLAAETIAQHLAPVNVMAEAPATDGWIEWHGGDCPTVGTINVRLRSDLTHDKPAFAEDYPVAAQALRWEHTDSAGDIVAYRLHKPTA